MMFKPNTPLYLRDVTFKTETVDGETRKIVVCSFTSQPFTREMANDLEIARHLFAADGEPLNDVISAQLAISMPVQQMTLKMAPDATPRFVIADVEVSKAVSVRKDKEGPVFAANFAVNFRYPEADTLLYLANAVNSQLFVTLDTQQGSLGLAPGTDEKPAPPKKQKKSGNVTELRPGVSEMFNDGGAPTPDPAAPPASE